MGHNKRLLLFRVQECGPALHCWPYPTTDISQFGALLNPIVSSASTSHLKFQQPLQTTGVFLEGGQLPSLCSPLLLHPLQPLFVRLLFIQSPLHFLLR